MTHKEEGLSIRDIADVSKPEDPLASKVASLEEQLAAEKDGRMEDRFIGLIVAIIIFNIVVLKDAASVLLPLAVLILELVVLLLLAKRMGSEDISRLIDRLLQSVSRSRPDGEG